MGKKSKGNKLAKMSEEERARYLQMRADIEEEARRRKMQLLSLYMKNKLKREDAFCRLNMAKINQEWRSILRQVKCQELRREVMEIKKHCKELMQRKDHTISRLMDELDMAEDMYGTLQQTHLETLSKMISIQQQRSDFFHQNYDIEKAAILQEYEKDFADFKLQRDNAHIQLECVAYQLEDRANNVMKQNYERYLECLDDIRSTMQLRLEQITKNGEVKLEHLWQEYQNVLSNYVKHTETFYAEYVDLKERDEENTKIVREHCYEIEKATDQLALLKIVASDTEEENDVKINYLKGIRDSVAERLATLRQKVEIEIKDDEDSFRFMSVESHHALKNLQDIVKKGEALLLLASVCRKLETEREKLLPLGLPPLCRQAFENTEDELQQQQAPPQELKDQTFAHWQQMENFWRRVNNATIDVVCLKQRKRHLEEEHIQLKDELREYLIDLNLSNGSNLHINDYLAKRPSSMHVDRVNRIEPEYKQQQQQQKCQSANMKSNKNSLRLPCRPLRAPYVEANFTNAVRSQRLAAGKMRLAKIVTIVNW